MKPNNHRIQLDRSRLSIEDVLAIAYQKNEIHLSVEKEFVEAINKGTNFVDRLIKEEGVIYGVNTGYGDSCVVAIPKEIVEELPHHLFTYHGCGLGQYLSDEEVRAVLVVRLCSLCKGVSGVSYPLLVQMTRLIQHDILPLIPSEGSVGASGDLTPLSYVAAVLCGEREVRHQGKTMLAKDALEQAGMQALRLRPKEGLAIMNGTAVMTALACLAYDKVHYLMQLSARITAMASIVLDGNARHFEASLFAVKPHPQMQQVAQWIRQDLLDDELASNEKRLQDRYSIRCAPHVIGVLADALPFMRQFIENELNSANDNPIIDAENEHILHGGHFYGGHIAFVMDSMKNAVANLADLADRQMALMVDARYNNGLPANLSGADGARASINHGLKALQISASAWTAEALKLTMPASVFSRSTECHNQDKVSMGTIAARDCLRVIELTEQVLAALLISVRQGITLRQRSPSPVRISSSIEKMMQQLEETVSFIGEDRRLDVDLKLLLTEIRQQKWELYA